MNAFGGLLVGAVISYCDAILKDVAIGASIVVSAIGSIYLFDFKPHATFAMGVVFVSYAVPMYAGRVDPFRFRKGYFPLVVPDLETGDADASSRTPKKDVTSVAGVKDADDAGNVEEQHGERKM